MFDMMGEERVASARLGTPARFLPTVSANIQPECSGRVEIILGVLMGEHLEPAVVTPVDHKRGLRCGDLCGH